MSFSASVGDWFCVWILITVCVCPSFRDFSWSPGDNIIAFWVPEDKDIPARVTLMQMPSRQEIRVRNLFNVVDCKLHWQRNGDYLCVKVDRTPKGTQVTKKRLTFTSRIEERRSLILLLVSGCCDQLWNLQNEGEAGSCWCGGDEGWEFILCLTSAAGNSSTRK